MPCAASTVPNDAPPRLIPAARLLALVLALLLGACAPRIQTPGPHANPPMPAHLTDTHFITGDGTELPLRRWLPPTKSGEKPKAVIGALHGFNDYSNAFADIGVWLAERGIAVIAYDQRGFGAAPQAGIWAGEERMTEDARDFLAGLRAVYPDIPLYALGESMGGGVLMATWAQAPYPVDGTILVAPAVWGRATMPFHQTAALWLSAHTLPWLRLTGEGLNLKPSDNIEMLKALSRDPLVIKATRIDAMWGITNLMDDALDAVPRFDAPALILYGTNDDIVPAHATLRMLDDLPEASRKVAIYEQGYHMLLRDLQAETVWRDIAGWLADRQAPLPSGADKVDARRALGDN